MRGGGVHCLNSDSVKVTNCNFVNNNAFIGGGLTGSEVKTIIIDSSRFVSNTVNGMGGAIAFEECSTAAVINSIIEGNIANEGGGVAFGSSKKAFIKKCEIRRNVSDYGGAISSLSGNVIVNDCILSHDTARTLGGAIHCLSCSLYVSRTSIDSNYSLENAGAVNLRNGFAIIDSSWITHNDIYNPVKTTKSKGFFVYTSSLEVKNSEIINDGMSIFVDTSNGAPEKNVIAENNWWGTNKGPYHPLLNPSGDGDRVSDYVDFIPWNTNTSIKDSKKDAGCFYIIKYTNRSIYYSFTLNKPSTARLSVFNVNGRRIDTIEKYFPLKGRHYIRWDMENAVRKMLPQNIYVYFLEIGSHIETGKIILLSK